jgi:chorismate dehydratase
VNVETSATNWGFLMTVKVARVPYLNTEPFYNDMERRGLQLQEILPSGIASALRKGEIDAGPVPLVDTFHLGDRFEAVSGFCIATTEQAKSVLLYSKRPIEEMTGARIGVTSEAGSSLHLLQLLLVSKHKVRPEDYVPM